MPKITPCLWFDNNAEEAARRLGILRGPEGTPICFTRRLSI
jgi:hypothetical protein